MKRTTVLSISAATILVMSALTLPVIASGWGPQHMAKMMHGSDDSCLQENQGHFMRMHRGNHGPMGMRTMNQLSDNPIYQSFDADENGEVSAAELEAGLVSLHDKFDADNSNSLSADEFSALFSEMTAHISERPFAMLDADGDGLISMDEMTFPAQMKTRMQRWHESDK